MKAVRAGIAPIGQIERANRIDIFGRVKRAMLVNKWMTASIDPVLTSAMKVLSAWRRMLQRAPVCRPD